MKKHGVLIGVTVGISVLAISMLQAEPPENIPPAGRGRGPALWQDNADSDGSAIRERMRQRKPDPAEFLEKYDADGDGKLSDEERSAAIEAHREERAQARLDQFFERFDADGDGCISREEVKAHFEARREEMEQKGPHEGRRPGKRGRGPGKDADAVTEVEDQTAE